MPVPTTAADRPRLLAPVRLPERLDGTRLEHLSASSLARFWRCAEAWRAHYLARVRGPESAELRRGWVVDAAIEAHFKALLTTGEPLPQRSSACRSATSRTSTPPPGSRRSTMRPPRSTGARTPRQTSRTAA